MHIVLINNLEITEIIKCTDLELFERDSKPSITFVSIEEGEGRMGGINAEFYIVDACSYEIGDILTENDLEQLKKNDRKKEFEREV